MLQKRESEGEVEVEVEEGKQGGQEGHRSARMGDAASMSENEG